MTDHTTPLRDRIAAAIWERQNPGRRWADCEYRWRADAEEDADAVLAVLPAPAAGPAIVDQVVAALQDKAEALSVEAEAEMRRDLEEKAQVWHEAADLVRRAARKATRSAQPAAGARQDGSQPLPTQAETAPADESPHVYMDCVQDSAAWAYALTKAGQIPEALEHVEAMERLLAVYRRAVGA